MKSPKILKTKIKALLTERELIQQCLDGERSGQFELVKRYSGMLMTICRRYAPDTPTAEDILQESLIQIFRNLPKYQPIGSFPAWMRKITVRAAIRWVSRTQKLQESLLMEEGGDIAQVPEVEQHLAIEEIIGYLQTLPTGYRTVFNLYVIEGYKHDEIAEMLGISTGTSRSQLARARKLLQEKIITNQMENFRSA